MNRIRLSTVLKVAALGALCWQASLAWASNLDNPTRIVVVPFFTEEGVNVTEAGKVSRHYRRTMRFINNQLVRHGFEVINPYAEELEAKEYNALMKRAREHSALAAQELTRKYATDIAYLVWLDIDKAHLEDGICEATARLEGEGYDSAARDLGVGLIKRIIYTDDDCDWAITLAEKEVGDTVGRTLTAWSGTRKTDPLATAAPGTVTAGAGLQAERDNEPRGGAVQENADALASLIEVRLEGGRDYAVVEAFGKALRSARGVTETNTYRIRIEPDVPQANYAVWRARIQATDTFALQANVMKLLSDVSDAGGTIQINGVPYRYTPAEIDRLKGIRPGDVTSRAITFVVDNELIRDQEFSRRHDAYLTTDERHNDPGFD